MDIRLHPIDAFALKLPAARAARLLRRYRDALTEDAAAADSLAPDMLRVLGDLIATISVDALHVAPAGRHIVLTHRSVSGRLQRAQHHAAAAALPQPLAEFVASGVAGQVHRLAGAMSMALRLIGMEEDVRVIDSAVRARFHHSRLRFEVIETSGALQMVIGCQHPDPTGDILIAARDLVAAYRAMHSAGFVDDGGMQLDLAEREMRAALDVHGTHLSAIVAAYGLEQYVPALSPPTIEIAHLAPEEAEHARLVSIGILLEPVVAAWERDLILATP